MSIGVYLYRGYLCRLGVAGLEAQYLHGKYLDHVEAQYGAIVIQRIQKSLINLLLIQRFVGYITKFICMSIYI